MREKPPTGWVSYARVKRLEFSSGRRRARGLRWRHRQADVARVVPLPARLQRAGAEVVRRAREDAAVPVARVRHFAVGAVVVSVRPVVAGDEDASLLADGTRHFGSHAPAGNPEAVVADGLDLERRPRGDVARARGDDAAESVRAIRDRARAARNLDAAQNEGIEVPCARPGALLRAHASSVEQDHAAAMRKAANGRNRVLRRGNPREARDVLESLCEIGGLPRFDVGLRHDRRPVGRWRLDRRGRPRRNADALLDDRPDGDGHRTFGGNRRHQERLHIPAVRQDDQHLERRDRIRKPLESAVRVRALRTGQAEHRDFRPRDGSSRRLHHHPPLQAESGAGGQEKSNGRNRCGSHARKDRASPHRGVHGHTVSRCSPDTGNARNARTGSGAACRSLFSRQRTGPLWRPVANPCDSTPSRRETPRRYSRGTC